MNNANPLTTFRLPRQQPSRHSVSYARVRCCFLGALLVCSFAATAAESDEATASERQQNLPRNAESSLDGLVFPQGEVFNFVERTGNTLLATPLERHGQLWQEQSTDDKPTLIMELKEPRWERRELSETQVSLVRRRSATGRSRPREQRLNMRLDESKPSHALMLALVALVNGEHQALLSQFSASPRRPADDGWDIELTPADSIEGLCALRLSGNGAAADSELTSIYLDQCEQRWQEIILTPASQS